MPHTDFPYITQDGSGPHCHLVGVHAGPPSNPRFSLPSINNAIRIHCSEGSRQSKGTFLQGSPAWHCESAFIALFQSPVSDDVPGVTFVRIRTDRWIRLPHLHSSGVKAGSPEIMKVIAVVSMKSGRALALAFQWGYMALGRSRERSVTATRETRSS